MTSASSPPPSQIPGPPSEPEADDSRPSRKIPLLIPASRSKAFERVAARANVVAGRRPSSAPPPLPEALRRRASHPPRPPRDSRIPPPDPVRIETLARICKHAGVATDGLEARGEVAGRAVYALPVGAEDPVERWRGLRGVAASTGLRPLFLLHPDGGTRRRLRDADAGDVDGDLELAGDVDVGALLSARYETRPSMIGGSTAADGGLFAADDPSRTILLVAARAASELAAILRFERGRTAPAHVAVHTTWQRRFGVEPMAFSDDTVFLHLGGRRMTRDAAVQLVDELCAYCPSIRTVDASARALTALLDDSRILAVRFAD